MPRWLAAWAGAAGAAALQLETSGEPREQFDGRACLDDVLFPGARSGADGCPAKFYMFDVTDPAIADCYGKYVSDDEYKKWEADGMESHHTGPIFVARNLPKHRCAVQDPAEADLFVVPPFLPQWNQNFDNKDKVCQPKVMNFAKRSEAYRNSVATGHSNFVVLNWWKGREWGSMQPLLFPNATFVGKDCKSEVCSDPFVGWPYFDNTPGVFAADDTFVGTQSREKLAVGVWGSRRGGDGQRKPLEGALRAAEDSEFMTPGSLGDHGASILGLYKNAKFCVNPRGDSLSRRSLSTCVLAGSIPVILVDKLNLPFEHVIDYSKFAVRLPQKTSGQEMLDTLRSIPADQVAKLQRNTVCVRRAFLYDARSPENAVARGGLLDFLLADVAHVALRRQGWQRPS